MSKIFTPFSTARRSAEALLNQSKKREASFKWEQRARVRSEVAKTARLRELRLAKEAADKGSSLDSRFTPDGAASSQEVDEYRIFLR